jgi:hypothetical protein
MNHLLRVTVASAFAALLVGCDHHELDCAKPRTHEEQQQCAHKESTEGRIAPTEKPKNWLEIKP